MNKAKKIAIALCSTLGISTAICIPLLIISQNNKHKEISDATNAKIQRYRLANWLDETKHKIELLTYLVSDEQIKTGFNFFTSNSIDEKSLFNFFRRILFKLFDISDEEYNIKLEIKTEITNSQKTCILHIKWYFIDKKMKLIFKNIKYYDILKISF